jgi:calcineurin-like phosphoesterase family protein
MAPFFMSLFVVSDTHFGHAKMLSFVNADGSPVRPFNCLEEMHEAMVERWNSRVHARDTVYHLGDVAIPRSGLKMLERLNGRKILMRGNHDIFKLRDYAEYFDDIRGCHYRDGLVFSHIPVHRNCFISERYKGNVHGHLHGHLVMHEGEKDSFYFNACVEHHDYAPVEWEKIQAYFAQDHGRASDVQHAHSGAMESRHS